MGGATRTVGNLYDLNGNRVRIVHPDGSYFTYEHDGLDRPTLVRENGGAPIAAFVYDNAGRRASSGWTATTAYAYDSVGRLQTLSHNLAGTSRDHILGFAYNPASQIHSRSASNDAYAWTGTYNMVRPYAANGLNQYTSAGPATFGHDDNGNLASTANGPASTSYVYDVENRLVSATGAQAAELLYDPLGRLFQVSSGAAVRRLAYDGDALVAEYNAVGAMAHRYVHGNDPGADDPLVWYDNLASGWRRALIADHQGSVIQVADLYGNPIATNSYDPWGLPGATPAGRFGYTGQTWVPELGLWYYKARFYSPTTGRFLQVDPIGYDDQINLYAYVGNDPINRNDFSGNAAVVAAAPLLCAGPQAAACGIIAGGVAIAGCVATKPCREAASDALNHFRDQIRDLGKGLWSESKPEIHEGKQGKHQPEHNNFRPGSSELTDPDPQGLVDEGAGTGRQVGTVPVGEAGSKEHVDWGRKIGSHVDPETGKRTPTSTGIIHYDKDKRVHIVPARPSS